MKNKQNETDPYHRRLWVRPPPGAFKPLFFNGLRFNGSKAGARIDVLAALPLPFLAGCYQGWMFHFVALGVAVVALGAAFWIAFSLSARIRRVRESRRMSAWWARRGDRWSSAQRGGYRP